MRPSLQPQHQTSELHRAACGSQRRLLTAQHIHDKNQESRLLRAASYGSDSLSYVSCADAARAAPKDEASYISNTLKRQTRAVGSIGGAFGGVGGVRSIAGHSRGKAAALPRAACQRLRPADTHLGTRWLKCPSSPKQCLSQEASRQVLLYWAHPKR